MSIHKIPCQIGFSAGRKVAMGFAPARLLAALSFADVLVEETGRGYQRRFNAKHSLDFRRYIQGAQSSTIPLTFNLRPSGTEAWRLTEAVSGLSVLEVREGAEKVMVQVDCQHRLGYLSDVDVTLPFMTFIGLDQAEEMEIFSVINSKARGLSNSLLDFHEASLAGDLAREKPELYIALQLNIHPDSPWSKQLDLGGVATSGMMRRASLRTMQKAVKKFLSQTQIIKSESAEAAAEIVIAFWSAVSVVLQDLWNAPRAYLINKGVGVYALMIIAADLYTEAKGQICDKRYFVMKLSEFLGDIDWSRQGPFQGFGGEGGVGKVVASIRQSRGVSPLRMVNRG
ncbi:DGQHR domain-containing protein [Edaphobacter sp. DSM 109919]|uniref:DGQHR domain-containing protein n=1 Tax=Edaphobacter paludis TaxID=3035702 RepID=A0AAU7CUH3_9BACT